MEYRFDFESMHVYRLAVEVALWARRTRWPGSAGKLKSEAIRACDSVVLNIAEGRMRLDAAGNNHFRIARGSAGEAMAVLDLVVLPDGPAQQQKLRRIGAMLNRLG